MVTPTNYAIALAGFTLHGAAGTLGFLQHPPVIHKQKPKKVLTSECEVPGTVSYDKSEPGNCIACIKRLEKGLR